MMVEIINQPLLLIGLLTLLTLTLLIYFEIIYLPFSNSDLILIHHSVPPPKVNDVGWGGDNQAHLISDYQPIQTGINLLQLVLKGCPSLNGLDPFFPSIWLLNAHLQTIFGSFNLIQPPKFKYTRDWVKLSDGGQVGLDWYPKPNGMNLELDDTTPTVLILHGLGGGSEASYVRALVDKLVRPPDSSFGPLRSVVFNHRGCGDTKITTPRLYTAGDTADLREVIAHIRAQLPHSPIFAVGFSIGANILAKYLGEVGEAAPLVGAVSISNPFDLVWCSRNMAWSWVNKLIYAPFLVRRLKRIFKTHSEVLSKAIQERDWRSVSDFDMDLIILNPHVMLARHLGEDAKGEMPTRFETLNQYYRESSCNRYLHNIHIPTLFINALDDPIAPIAAIACEEIHANPNLLLAVTRYGGHLGWWAFRSAFSVTGCSSWVTWPIIEFINAIRTTQVRADDPSPKLVK